MPGATRRRERSFACGAVGDGQERLLSASSSSSAGDLLLCRIRRRRLLLLGGARRVLSALLQRLWCLANPVGDHRAIRRVLGHPVLFTLEPACLAGFRHLHHSELAGEDVAILLENLSRRLPERRVVVQDVEAPAERREDEVVLAFLHRQVAHGNGGEVVAQADPLLAAVDGEEQAELGADEEEIGIDVILGKASVGPLAGRSPAIDVQVTPRFALFRMYGLKSSFLWLSKSA